MTNGPATGHPDVTLSMIVRNESRNLTPCLASVADLVGEMIIVDTGSTDNTVEIAERFGALVVHDPWQDNFARARNVSLDHCTGSWVFWMDADEFLEDSDRARLRKLFSKPAERQRRLCDAVSLSSEFA